MGLAVEDTSEGRELNYPRWQIPFEEAIVESDLTKLSAKIQIVELLIFERLKQLESSSDGVVERGAIDNALNSLRVLKRERLAFPDWK